MARQPRAFAPGLIYHVIARGNRREDVFLDGSDYGTYLERLAAYRVRYAVTLHAYCLMPNHVHLVVRTARAPLNQFMQGVQQSYTQWYNRRHGQVGHVFQGRYKALLCATDEYLVTLVRYVHLNPVRAGLAVRAEDYPYSAHRAYLAGAESDLVDPLPVLDLVGGVGGYARLVEAEAPPAATNGRTETARSTVEDRRAEAPSVVRPPLGLTLTWLAGRLHTTPEALRGPDRSRAASRARTLAAFVLIRRLGYRVADVAVALNRDGSTITIAVGRAGRRLASEPGARQEVERLVDCMEVKA
jgi:REP element-mobilizing transposase RayT